MLALERWMLPRLILVALIAIVSRAGFAQSPDQGEVTKADCGTNALFLLLNLEGRPVTLDRLERSLPPRQPEGYSMAELSQASASLGLDLEGVRFGKGDRPLERPAIAFLKAAQGGHFVVIRPVGTTGTRVQLIDPPYPPWVVDRSQIVASHQWGHAILIPRESDARLIFLELATAVLAIIAAALVIRRVRRPPISG